MIERLWEVFHRDGEPGYLIFANNAKDAERIFRGEKRLPSKVAAWPHRADCGCEKLLAPCVKGVLKHA